MFHRYRSISTIQPPKKKVNEVKQSVMRVSPTYMSDVKTSGTLMYDGTSNIKCIGKDGNEIQDFFKTSVVEWVVVEKVHGANFCIYYDGVDFKYFGRNGEIKPESLHRFFSADVAVEKNKQFIKAIYDCSPEPFYLYCELFGGLYKGTTAPDSYRVQKEVDYCPHNDLYAFDIWVPRLKRYARYDEFVKFMEAVKFPLYARALFRGSFSDAYAYSLKHLEMKSTIPPYFGLEPISSREGHVVKCTQPNELGNITMFKHKGVCFIDVDESKKPSTVDTPSVISELLPFITPARVTSAKSKHSPDVKFGVLLREICSDILEDAKNQGVQVEMKNVKKELEPMVKELIFKSK